MTVESELRAKVRPQELTGVARDSATMVRAALNVEDTLKDALRTMVGAAKSHGLSSLTAEIDGLATGGAAWMSARYTEARQRLIDAGEDVSAYPPENQLPREPPVAPVGE